MVNNEDDLILDSLKKISLVQADFKGVSISENAIEIEIYLFSPALHIKKTNEFLIKDVLKIFDKNVFVFSEIKNKKDISQFPEEKKLKNIKNIIAIASGKGGVGKSTVTSNIAINLNKKGYKIGIIDADIYGPSIPKIFNVENEKPFPSDKEAGKIIPIVKNGIKIMSIGFFTDINQAVIWRGAMATKAIRQMIFDIEWGELDFLLIDLPPGTGDIHLSIVQFIALDGVVIVSTPQDMAILDARRGLQMFLQDSINVPVLGLIENMAYFIPEEFPENKYYIFGKNGVKKLSEEKNIPFLGEIPIIISVRENCDNGRMMENKDSTLIDSIDQIIKNLLKSLKVRKDSLPPTKNVEITNMKGCS